MKDYKKLASWSLLALMVIGIIVSVMFYLGGMSEECPCGSRR